LTRHKSVQRGGCGKRLVDDTTKRLRERIRLLEAVIDNFPGGIILTDNNLEVVLCNGQQRDLLDYPETLFANGNPSLRELFHFNAARGEYGPGRVEDLVGAKMELVRQGVAHVFERTRPNGTVLEIRGAPLREGGFVTTYLDVTEQRRNLSLIAHLAHHDTLTDLPNRALLRDRLGQNLARARRGEQFALHYLDLDGFKTINDRHGHETGDRLLIEVAARLRDTAREVDTVARFGGDEFVILQNKVNQAGDAAKMAQRIIRAIRMPFGFGPVQLHIGASMGIALAPADGSDADELLRKADAALYRCKSEGGGGFRFHGPAFGALAAIS
jgi:diguanylate cyclase (GGDEF)-like protein